MSLFVNGKSALTGSVFIPGDTTAAIQLPGITLSLNFQKGTLAASLDLASGVLTLTGFDNPLGAAATLSGVMINNAPHSFAFSVHSLGEGASPARIFHYTVYPA